MNSRRGSGALRPAPSWRRPCTCCCRPTGESGTRFPGVERIAKALRVDPADLFRADAKAINETKSTMADINGMLAGLSEPDLLWVSELIEVALRRK